MQNGRRDWDGFFGAAGEDTPIGGSVALLAHLDPGTVVVLLTARPHSLRETTLMWVAAQGYRWDLLIMRGTADAHLSSPAFKQKSVVELRNRGYEPGLAFDDDQRNVDMFRAEGIPTVYVHSGYYEA